MARPRNKRPVSVAISLSSYDGLWHGYLTVGRKPNGKPDIAHRTGRTYEECADKIRALEDAIAAGEKVKTGRKPTVAGWFAAWLTDIAPHQPGGGPRKKPLAPRTLQDYWSICETWVFPHLGGLQLDQLESDDLDKLYRTMYEVGTSSARVLKVHAMIRRGLAVALQRSKVGRNVAAMMDNPGAPSKKRGKVLSLEQASRVIEVVAGRDDEARWLTGLNIGPRQGEALALRWAYLDLNDETDEGTVDTSWQIQRLPWRHGCGDPVACQPKPDRRGRIRSGHKLAPCSTPCEIHTRPCPKPCRPGCTKHAAVCPGKKGGGLVFARPKTFREEEGAHIVALAPTVVASLKRHKKLQAAARLFAGAMWEDNDLVFCTVLGRPIDPRQDYEALQEILKLAGLEGAGTHLVRRSAATIMLELGEDIAVVQEVLNHTDIRTTRGYTHVSVGLTARAAQKMEDGLFAPKTTDLATERERRRPKAS